LAQPVAIGEAVEEAAGAARVPRPGVIKGNPANLLVETGTPLKSGNGWVKRWMRMTVEDHNRYLGEHYQYMRDINSNTRELVSKARLTPEEATSIRRDLSSAFRTEWLSRFIKERRY
jgi:hypothetical protein